MMADLLDLLPTVATSVAVGVFIAEAIRAFTRK